MFETNEAALRAAVAAFNDPENRESYLELFADDVLLHGYPRGLIGLDGARTFYTRLWQAFPDARLTVEEVLAGDDRLAARYRLSGIQTREFYGAPSTGEELKIDGIAWLRFREQRAVEVWQASGTLDTLTRLTARAALAPTRRSASVEAAALRWDERHAEG